MFKKTPENPQFDLFATPSTQPGKREAKKYDDPHGWHNLFYANVTSKIEETVFSPLFKEGNMGAPNASIRVIIAMSVIKEGFGCSDEELFEKCQFDLLVRKALGLFSLSNVVPSINTYCLPGRRIYEYENRHGVNLMEKSFEQLTGNQLSRFKISGKSVRQVKGYSVNITETCDDADEQKDKPNLIVNVQVKGASAADNDYLKEAITNIGEKVSADTIEKVYADGAYQSKDNKAFAEENSIELITSGLQGRQSKYDPEMKEGDLVVTHIETGEVIPAHKTGDKWRIATGGKSKYRYFTDEQIATAELRRKLAAIPLQEQRKRNNVEATIFQYCFHTRNNKTRYRGLLKHKLFTFAKCLWINHVRLGNYPVTTGQRAHENGLITDFRRIKSSILEKLFIVIVF